MQEKLIQILNRGNEVLLGKEKELRLAMISMLANGHLLIEDIPGVGKTTMVYLLGKLLGLKISRIQFTNDMLPSDIIGTSIFDQSRNDFSFKKGPIFGQLILADELNRATPKTQSALLQSMEERKISIDGEELKMEEPFLIIATQNPFQQIGTFQLPESQIDRFFMGFSLDFPAREYEKMIIQGEDSRKTIHEMDAISGPEELLSWQKEVKKVTMSDSLLEYILDLLEKGRSSFDEGLLLSPRSGRDLALAAKCQAWLEKRDFVIPEDVQYVASAVLSHRLGAGRGVQYGRSKINQLIELVPLS